MISAPGSVHPAKSVPTRLVAGTWMLACVVLYASYTANLVASLTVSEVKPPFNSLYEMVRQTEYTYGIKQGSIVQVILAVRLTETCLHLSTLSVVTDLNTILHLYLQIELHAPETNVKT